jgi:hypothetical protein
LSDFTSMKTGDRRCAYVLFPVPKWQDIQKIRIEVQKISTSATPESSDCSLVTSKLHAKKIWINVFCEQGEHYSGWVVTAKPDNMTMVEARTLAYTEGFSNYVKGPWVFVTEPFSSSSH